MRKAFALFLSLPWVAFAVEPRVECPNPGAWTIETVRTASGAVEEFEFRLKSPSAGPNKVVTPMSGYVKIVK